MMKETIEMLNNRIAYINKDEESSSVYTVSFEGIDGHITNSDLPPAEKIIMAEALHVLCNKLYREGPHDVWQDDTDTDAYNAKLDIAAKYLSTFAAGEASVGPDLHNLIEIMYEQYPANEVQDDIIIRAVTKECVSHSDAMDAMGNVMYPAVEKVSEKVFSK